MPLGVGTRDDVHPILAQRGGQTVNNSRDCDERHPSPECRSMDCVPLTELPDAAPEPDCVTLTLILDDAAGIHHHPDTHADRDIPLTPDP